MVGLVVFGLQAGGVGADTQIDVFGNDDDRRIGFALLDGVRDAKNLAVGGLRTAVGVTVDAELAATGQRDATGEAAAVAKGVEQANDSAGVVAAVGSLFLETIDFTDDADRNDHGVI